MCFLHFHFLLPLCTMSDSENTSPCDVIKPFCKPFSVKQTRRDVIKNAVEAEKLGLKIHDWVGKSKWEERSPFWTRDMFILIAAFTTCGPDITLSIKRLDRKPDQKKSLMDVVHVYKVKSNGALLEDGETTLLQLAEAFPAITNELFLNYKRELSKRFSPLHEYHRIFRSQFLAQMDPDGSLFYIACINAFTMKKQLSNSNPDPEEIERSVRASMDDDFHKKHDRIIMCQQFGLFTEGMIMPHVSAVNNHCKELWLAKKQNSSSNAILKSIPGPSSGSQYA